MKKPFTPTGIRLWKVCLILVCLVSSSWADNQPLSKKEGQSCWILANKKVEVAITELGGHMAPVRFYRDTPKPVQPYYVSPWQNETPRAMPAPVLVPLRGDFFCLPFGGNADAVEGEKHPPHGEIAGSLWKLAGTTQTGPVSTLTLSIDPKNRPGSIRKRLFLVEGQNVVYSQDEIKGFVGKAPLGHHATLAMPETEDSVRIATSPIRFGMTNPGLFSDPKQGEYQSLLPGSRFTDLTKVPVAWKDQPDADLTRLPARKGHADLIQIINEPWEKTNGPAWITATFASDGFTWFAFKDPAILNSTVFWIENHGRHGSPWNGRNNCLGLEDVTAFFAEGLKASIQENQLTKEGVKTAVELKADHPTVVNYIQGVIRIPEGFDIVKSVEFEPGKATFISASGKRVTTDVHHEFVRSGKIP